MIAYAHTLTLTLSSFNHLKNHLPPDLAADEKPYILTITPYGRHCSVAVT